MQSDTSSKNILSNKSVENFTRPSCNLCQKLPRLPVHKIFQTMLAVWELKLFYKHLTN